MKKGLLDQEETKTKGNITRKKDNGKEALKRNTSLKRISFPNILYMRLDILQLWSFTKSLIH